MRRASLLRLILLAALAAGIAWATLGYAGREALAGSEGLIQKGLLALGLLAIVAFLPRLVRRLHAAPMMSTAEMKSRLDSGEEMLMLDVRGADEYAGELGHIPDSRNIPLGELAQRLAELGDNRDRSIAIVCRTDKRSAKAAEVLMRVGFSNIRVVRGGMEQWNREGREIAR